MSLVQSVRPTAARLVRLAGMLALPLLAGCAYDDGYYGPSSSYGYGYDNGYDYGYGGYGYSYGYYGNPCWPYGCSDRRHRHHRHNHWDDDDNDDSHQRHRGAGMSDRPRFDPGVKSQDVPHFGVRPNADNDAPNQPKLRRRTPSSPYVWVPQQRDSKN